MFAHCPFVLNGDKKFAHRLLRNQFAACIKSPDDVVSGNTMRSHDVSNETEIAYLPTYLRKFE